MLKLNRRLDDVTFKYRELLQKENQVVAEKVKMDALQVGIAEE